MKPWRQKGWEALCIKRHGSGGYGSLSADEKLWFNIRVLIDLTCNGGLISYFYNSGADTLNDCLAALDRLDAADVRTQVERVAALFGADVPPTVDARSKVINSWPDNDLQRGALLDDVDGKLYDRFHSLEIKLEEFLNSSAVGAVH